MRFLFYLSLNLFFLQSLQAQQKDFPRANFSKADSIAALYLGHDLKDLAGLSIKLTQPLESEVEKFRAIHTWICQNIKNDFGLFEENQRKRAHLNANAEKLREWNKAFTKRTFSTLLEENKTVCTGYAYLVKEMTNFIGIQVEIIDGYGRSSGSNVEELGIVNHSWNAVLLEGKWYLCDPSWSAGNFNVFSGLKVFVDDYNDGFFLCQPELFFRNHFPLEAKWTLLDSSYSKQKFLSSALVYGAAFKFGIFPVGKSNFQLEVTKDEVINFNFQISDSLNSRDLYLELRTENKVLSFEADSTQLKDNTLTLSTTFSKKGLYDLHIKLGEDYLCSYVIKVKR
tara:strand:- start:15288 stop:16307 length:1020 start_codon:yes stop_codon:yes gene_type:complete